MDDGHYDHVDNDNGHHRVEVTISKGVGKEDKDKEPLGDKADAGTKKHEAAPQV